jgi:hypothetical protein
MRFLCSVEADLDGFRGLWKPVRPHCTSGLEVSSTSDASLTPKYWSAEFDVVIMFDGIKLSAKLRWKEGVSIQLSESERMLILIEGSNL